MAVKKIKIIHYQYGILANTELEDWVNKKLDENKDYNLFQILEGTYWSPSGNTSWRKIVLIQK